MEYKVTPKSNGEFMLDGKTTLEEAVKNVSKLTKIPEAVLLEGAKEYGFIKIIENPTLLNLDPKETQSIKEVREVLDYMTGVDF